MTFDDRPIHSHSDPAQTAAERAEIEPLAPATADDESTDTTAQTERKQGSMVREIIETLLLALIIFLAVRAVVLNFRVDGLSMMPNLENNEMLLVNRNAYLSFDSWALVDWLPLVDHEEENIVHLFSPPQRGDIVVFDAPVPGADKPYIKRIIGLPGETIEARNGSVYVDGQKLDEPYLQGEETWCNRNQDCEPVTVPEGSIFVLGDNRDNSQDSRAFGPVDIDSVIGKAWVTYWPIGEAGVVPHYDYPEISEGN